MIDKEKENNLEEAIEEAPKETPKEDQKTEKDIDSTQEQTEEVAGSENDHDDETEEETIEEDEEEAEALHSNEAMEYRDKLLRKIAEFENYKKRTSEEFLRLIDTANQDLIIKLLPVLDDLERMEKNYKPDMKLEDLKKGVDMIFGKFKTLLTNLGVEEIEAVGEEFDPDVHEALLQMEQEGTKPNTIIDQHEKGYKLKEKIIRHSKVIVAK